MRTGGRSCERASGHAGGQIEGHAGANGGGGRWWWWTGACGRTGMRRTGGRPVRRVRYSERTNERRTKELAQAVACRATTDARTGIGTNEKIDK